MEQSIDIRTFMYAIGSSDKAGNSLPSNEYGYGPYDSITDAQSFIEYAFGSMDDAPMGLTVGIKSDNTLIEYWITKNSNNNNVFSKKNGNVVWE